MKKLLVFALFAGFVLPIQSASAVVSCQVVKSTILKYEKTFQKRLLEIQYIVSKDDELAVKKSSYDIKKLEVIYAPELIAAQKFWSQTKELTEIWKLGTNNPKCFTNTQKMQLKWKNFKNPKMYLTMTEVYGEMIYFNSHSYDSIYKY